MQFRQLCFPDERLSNITTSWIYHTIILAHIIKENTCNANKCYNNKQVKFFPTPYSSTTNTDRLIWTSV